MDEPDGTTARRGSRIDPIVWVALVLLVVVAVRVGRALRTPLLEPVEAPRSPVESPAPTPARDSTRAREVLLDPEAHEEALPTHAADKDELE